MASKKKFTLEDLEKGLVLSGLLAPVNEEELHDLKRIQKRRKKEANKEKKLSKSEKYFQRSVLAAKIVSELYQEPTFGHVKLQKLMYLCENVKKMDVTEGYAKQAAGPYDRKLMHSVDSELKNQKWFEAKKERGGKFTYQPLEKHNGFLRYYNSYFKNEADKIQWLLKAFKRAKTEQVEIVATIYYCVQEMSNKGLAFTEKLLLDHFYSFHRAKEKFDGDRVLRAYQWMIEKKIVTT